MRSMLLTSITNSNKAQIACLGEEVLMDCRGISEKELEIIQKVSLITAKYGCKIMGFNSENFYLDVWCPDENYKACVEELEEVYEN